MANLDLGVLTPQHGSEPPLAPEVKGRSKLEPKKRTMKDFVRDYVKFRVAKIKSGDRSLLRENRILLSDIWYDLFEPLEKAGYGLTMLKPEARKRRRETIQVRYVKEVCDELGITRAQAGIIVGEAAHMYFRGSKYVVNIDKLAGLQHKGTDILIIEKEGIAEQLSYHAARYGIALVHTRGFLTEYAEDLSSMADTAGGHIAILTDFDISGMVISKQVPNVPRIGVDFKTLEDLGLNAGEVEETYQPDLHHLQHVLDNHYDFPGLDIDYLKTKRIEINRVRNRVGSTRLWEWVVKKLEQEFPSRDYNRAIGIPTASDFRPSELDELVHIIDALIAGVLTPLIEEYKLELHNHLGFIDDINRYESELQAEFQDEIDRHEVLGPLRQSIVALLRKYKGTGDRENRSP